MKFLLDLLPILLFFATLKTGEHFPEAAHTFANQWFAGLAASGSINAKIAPIIIATIVAALATTAQIVWLKARKQKVDSLLWLSFASVVILGALTVYLQDETFIKWKPTVLYWAIAIAIIVSQWVTGKSLIRSSMEAQISLPEPIWNKVSLSWISFFTIMGILNLIVAFNFSTDTWATFKAFGSTGLTLVFVIAQSLLLAKHVEEPKT